MSLSRLVGGPSGKAVQALVSSNESIPLLNSHSSNPSSHQSAHKLSLDESIEAFERRGANEPHMIAGKLDFAETVIGAQSYPCPIART